MAMELLFLLTIISAILYAVLAAMLHRAPEPVSVQPDILPQVAVLVAMRNEEAHIADCLVSLTRQSYPMEAYDVFVLDDRSQDRSSQIAAQFSKEFSNVHLQKITEDRHGLSGKMNALAQALQTVEHEIVLITDADCVVPSSWVETMVSFFEHRTGMVGGLTVLFPFGELKINNPLLGLWAKIQALDWIFLQAMAAANSRFGKPITILGNNFGFRKKAYLEVGGFESLGFSITEDFALMEALRKQTSWKVLHTLDKNSAIYSRPMPTIKDFFRQRLRWVKGGKSVRPWGIFILGFAVWTHAVILIGLIMNFFHPFVWGAMALLLLTDGLVIAPVIKKLRLQKLWPIFPLFELFHFGYLLIFSVLPFLPIKVRWKGREFRG